MANQSQMANTTFSGFFLGSKNSETERQFFEKLRKIRETEKYEIFRFRT